MPKKSNFQIVENALGTTTANAIRGLAREEAEDVIKGLREEVNDLFSRQKENIAAAKADGSPEAAQAANEGSRAVNEAKDVVKEAEADPTPEKAAEAADAVEVAKDKVKQAESSLKPRLEAIEEILMPWRVGEKLGDRQPSRLDGIEMDMSKLVGQIDQAESAYNDARDMVRSNRRPALWIVALVTFVVALAIAGVFAIFSSLTFFWNAVWLAVATTAFVTIVTWVLEDGISKFGKRRKSMPAREENDELSIMEEKQGASAH